MTRTLVKGADGLWRPRVLVEQKDRPLQERISSFKDKCEECKGPIEIGDKILWRHRYTRHFVCPDQDKFHISKDQRALIGINWYEQSFFLAATASLDAITLMDVIVASNERRPGDPVPPDAFPFDQKPPVTAGLFVWEGVLRLPKEYVGKSSMWPFKSELIGTWRLATRLEHFFFQETGKIDPREIHLYERCLDCDRPLHDPVSQLRGYGSECIKRHPSTR